MPRSTKPKFSPDTCGRMISFNKQGPKGHVCVFNGNLCIKTKGKLWFGDIDITADKNALIQYAQKLGEDLYILREMDARFRTADNPVFENAVAVISPNGTITMRTEND